MTTVRGRMVKLAGVTAAATQGRPRIIMGEADAAALRVSDLAHVVSAKSLSASAAGIYGRCRVTRQLLTPKGAAASLALREIDGFMGLGVSSATAAASLALPPGSASASYSLVMALHLAASDIAGASPVNPINTCAANDSVVAACLRYYGSTSATNADKFLTGGGSAISTTVPYLVRSSASWMVVSIDFDDATKMASMSLNGGVFNSAVKAANHVPGENGYVEIGLHTSSLSLRNSVVGDLYVFNDSMLGTTLRRNQLAAVIEGLKTDYAIG